mmetsp:Transcript_22328/g.78245  ORF Transcript_22328/g.78245 Transcript_22328/m.78245 type:complete len:223 (-) Transcript_22328:1042-1710(-)
MRVKLSMLVTRRGRQPSVRIALSKPAGSVSENELGSSAPRMSSSSAHRKYRPTLISRRNTATTGSMCAASLPSNSSMMASRSRTTSAMSGLLRNSADAQLRAMLNKPAQAAATRLSVVSSDESQSGCAADALQSTASSVVRSFSPEPCVCPVTSCMSRIPKLYTSPAVDTYPRSLASGAMKFGVPPTRSVTTKYTCEPSARGKLRAVSRRRNLAQPKSQIFA